MKQQTFNNINTLLEPKKLISIGILCLIAFLILWFLWKKLKSTAGNVVQDIKDSAQLSSYMETSGQKLSYSEQEYKAMAEQLYTAMYGGGTDEEKVLYVFNLMNNDADVYKLVNVFGQRKGFWSFDSENLYEWIANDGMSSDVNKVLSGKGITVRF